MRLSKRFISIILCACMLFAFAACAPDTLEVTDAADTTEAALPETDPVTETTPVETEPTPTPASAYYDDYLTEIAGVFATAEGASVKSGNSIELIEKNGVKYFHAKGIGASVVTDGKASAEVTVEKAKLNLIVIMGQSNSGNHFDNATSDITCPLGTAYWWGGGRGIAAKTPYDFT